MTREELEAILNDERSTELAKVCAESALKDLRIKELEEVNDELEKVNEQASKDIAEQCKKIKELEDDKLRQENYCESLVNENKRLNEIIISKDMVGAELHNENKALRHNLEDWKAENEALKARIKELEASQPKWVSVEERLPPKLEDVLLTNGNECKQGYLCQYWCKENEPLWNFADGLDIIPTHWMPLPQPPKSED